MSCSHPAIWVRTPYNFNYWEVQNGVPRDMTAALTAVKRGYAYVDMQERGHFFAEGNYDILGAPISDGDDELKYLSAQPWSNGTVGTTGCSGVGKVGTLLRDEKLVSRWRGADALHRLVDGGAKSTAADVSGKHIASRSDSRFQIVRSCAAIATR